MKIKAFFLILFLALLSSNIISFQQLNVGDWRDNNAHKYIASTVWQHASITFEWAATYLNTCSENQKNILLSLMAIPIGFLIGILAIETYKFYTHYQTNYPKPIKTIETTENTSALVYSTKLHTPGFKEVNATFDAPENLHNLIQYFTHKKNKNWEQIQTTEKVVFSRYIEPILYATFAQNQEKKENYWEGLIQKMRKHETFSNELDNDNYDPDRRDMSFLHQLKYDFTNYLNQDPEAGRIYKNLILNSLEDASRYPTPRQLGRKPAISCDTPIK